MRITLLRAILFLEAIFSVGCGLAPSIQPLYTPQDSTFDASLLGVWVAPDNWSGRMVVTRLTGTSYQVFLEDSGASSFTARLVQLGPARFVDCFPGEPGFSNESYKAHLIRAHTFAQVWLAGDDLKIGWLAADWLTTGLGSNGTLDRIMAEDQLIISAPTSDLRAFAAQYADTAAFGTVTEWQRGK